MKLLPYHPRLLELLREYPAPGRGHAWLYRVALHIRHYHTEQATFRFLRECANHWGNRVVPDGELWKAIRKAYSLTSEEHSAVAAPDWSAPDPSAIQRMVAATAPLFGLESLELEAHEVLAALFTSDALVCVGYNMAQGETALLAEILHQANQYQFIVPNRMSALRGTTQDGRDTFRSLANTGPREFLVIESDSVSKAEQARILSHLATLLPLTLVVDSGGKSLHGWYACRDAGRHAVRCRSLRHPPPMPTLFQPNTASRNHKGPSMNHERQGEPPINILTRLRETDPEFLQQAEARGVITTLPPALLLRDLKRPPANDATELIRHRFLCRGGSVLFPGPTGKGKSSAIMQIAINFAAGRPCFGLEPIGPLKILIVQAENDEGDMAEMRDGILEHIGLTAAEMDLASANIRIVHEDSKTGLQFADLLDKLLAEYKPDLVFIDPAFSYLGGDASSQKEVTPFLRNMLNPVIHRHGVGLWLNHHTNKPAPAKEKGPPVDLGAYVGRMPMATRSSTATSPTPASPAKSTGATPIPTKSPTHPPQPHSTPFRTW
ncbi:MAG: AAA family ATPase [Kiritimatiellaeota bacterium]|nr:AAA family ATPase [Kiritimatiellota bacterium]